VFNRAQRLAVSAATEAIMKKQCGLTLSAAGLLLLLWGTPAGAGELDAFDRNGDGSISFEEVMKHLEPSVRTGFDTLDRNHDGVLSDKDFDDVRDGMQELEDWLKELIPPLLRKQQDEDGLVEV